MFYWPLQEVISLQGPFFSLPPSFYEIDGEKQIVKSQIFFYNKLLL